MITILSGPIHSGKTTKLLQWAEKIPGRSGIATPVQNGLKVLYDLSEKKYYPFQTDDNTTTPKDCITIGAYRFLNSAFIIGRQILSLAAQRNPSWLIIDELGPLELRGQGWEPVAGQIINQYLSHQKNSDLILVIRENILPEALTHYGITEYTLFE